MQWFEDDTSDILSHAPLLLLPVKLAKDEGRAKKDYRLSIWEGGLEVNVALIEKAREHWGIDLPALREDETPESYFVRVNAVLGLRQRLTLRTFVTLCVLPPMILWRDLDPARWPEDAFCEHRLLPGLVGAAEVSGVDGDDTILDIDDPINDAVVPALITDADASQHRAIMDMAAGRDMAIEGPPGTGKSQTITNMIATALSQGKRVLFVAEKQAALRVVSDRLRASGFGALLLELHGDKASRTDVYAGVRERLEAQPWMDGRTVDEKRIELRRHRDLLRRYLSLVRAPLGKLGRTAHALAWREIRLRQLFTRDQIAAVEKRWATKDISNLDVPTLGQNRELLKQFGKALLAIEPGRDRPRTRWIFAARLDPFDQRMALSTAAAAGQSAAILADTVQRFRELGVALPCLDDDEILAASSQLSSVKPFSCSDEMVVRAALHYPDLCDELLNAQTEWQRQRDEIAQDVADLDSVSVKLAENLGEKLLIDRCPAALSAAQAEQVLNEALEASIRAVARDIDRLTTKLSDGVNTSAFKLRDIALNFSEFGAVTPTVYAALSLKLADSTADSIIASSSKDAKALLAVWNELQGQVDAVTFTFDDNELEDAADIIESTGSISRLFSGRYKTAWRKAVRLCVDASDRVQVVETLRKAASFLKARRSFEQDSKARMLFPELLWDGINSDFSSLAMARALVADMVLRFANLDEAGALRWWLSADETERQILSAGCDRISSVLTGACEAGFADVAAADLTTACSERAGQLQGIYDVGTELGVRLDAPLQRRTGGTIADAIINLSKAQCAFEEKSSNEVFGWVSDISTPLHHLVETISSIHTLKASTGPINFYSLLTGSDKPATLLSLVCDGAAALAKHVLEWENASERLWEVTEINTLDICEDLDWREAGILLAELAEDHQGASLAADLLKYRAAVASRDLVPLAEAATLGEVPADRLDDMYELLAISAVLHFYLGSDGQELGRLGSLTLDVARQSFKKVDKELHKLEAASIVARRLLDRAPPGVGYGRKADYTELRLLENEIALTRPRTALRDVVHRAGAALQAIKPVWMMSPTSIAQFIRPGSLRFDLLIIDEASQMRPEFSVSCILRADQFVVVGDPNQLPPSDHFQVANVEGADDDLDGVGVEDSTESILDLANQRFRTKPRLKWHYRSQHESLIQFSNREFYNRDLVVFPSPMANDDALLGVKCFYAPSYYEDTAYEASINQREAQLVIEQAYGLMQTHPERSIGIVAMNAKQTELIQNEFDRLIVEEERVRKYVEAFKGTIDEFFIKNLENVQGDERDIILISTVYGPDKNGNVRQNFGLMNREVGWRRLNVLVTRAKMSCRLITSLRPDDVKVTEKSSKGVIAFKSYLTYAHGGATYDDASGAETDSDFEIFVADALRGGGYEVIYQVGVEGFRIDLGVRHESCPVGFIAGIECDGATYHSGLTVRDRDHIRQTILENLGWSIYRVWSTDWFADPARETAKLLAWLESVRERTQRELGEQARPVEVIKPRLKDRQEPKLTLPEAKDLFAGLVPVAKSVQPYVKAELVSTAPREPRGRELRSIGDFQTYEAIRGKLYEIWRSETFLGEVEVVKRATAAPRLYGDQALAARSEYEGRVEATGDCFLSFDLYAAMREVASRAIAKQDPVTSHALRPTVQG